MAAAEERRGLWRSVPHLEEAHRQGDCQATSILFQHNLPHLSQTGSVLFLSIQIKSILFIFLL